MGQRAGDRSGVRRSRWVVVLALLVALVGALVGCGGDGDDGNAAPADADPSTTTTAGDSAGAGASATEAAPTTLPEGSVVVPVDEELAARLPSLFVGDGVVSDDETFDERLCDGRKAPTVPEGQARADYHVTASESVTIAAYRFPSGVGPYYLSVYSEAVRSCALAVGDSAELGVVDGVGVVYDLETTRGKAFIALALRGDVLWVLFQENTDGPPTVDSSTVDLFLQAVEA